MPDPKPRSLPFDWLEPQLARQVHDREQRVPELALHLGAVAGAAGLVQLGQLLVHLGARPVGVGPVEADRARLLAGARGAQEGRGALRDAVERAVLPLLGLLDGLELGPVREHRPCVLGHDVAEHVRVAAHQLGHDPPRHVVDAELPFGEAELGLEDDLEQEVAELLAVVGHVPGGDGVDHLVGLLDEVGDQRLQRLLAIPGAAVGSEQPLHEPDELGHGGARLLAGERRQIGERGGVFFGHGGAEHSASDPV